MGVLYSLIGCLLKVLYGFPTPSAGGVAYVPQNRSQCVAVSEYMYVLDLGRVRAQGDRASFGDDTQLRDMIAEWLDYQVD